VLRTKKGTPPNLFDPANKLNWLASDLVHTTLLMLTMNWLLYC